MDQAPVNYLVDASIYIFQYYFSLPDHWSSDDGNPTAAVYGYTTFLLRLIERDLLSETRSPKIALCFDESLGTCFRNDIYCDYKSSRALPDDALAFQLEACREVSELLGFQCFSSTTHEADDYIGSLAKKMRRSKDPIAILSRDKDLGQLLGRAQDFLWDYAKDERSYAPDIFTKFGVWPTQMADFLALVGDSIDDIPGVPGLGPKTAQALLQRFVTVEKLFNTLDRDRENALQGLALRGAATVHNKLLQHREQIFMAKQLSTIVDNLPLRLTSKELGWNCNKVERSKLKRFCHRMGFPKLNARIENVLSA